MEDPTSTSPGSIMPRYPWLLTQELDTSPLPARIKALRKIGVPYPEGFENDALAELEAQAETVVQNLQFGMVEAEPDREIIALIAYLQRLGTDISGGAPNPLAAPAAPPMPAAPMEPMPDQGSFE